MEYHVTRVTPLWRKVSPLGGREKERERERARPTKSLYTVEKRGGGLH